MSVYLGRNRIGASLPVQVGLNEGDEIVSATQISQLNDAVNYRTGKFDTSTIPQMINKLKSEFLAKTAIKVKLNNTPRIWVRPQGWPDLDSLNLSMSGDDYIYMTYDGYKTSSASAIALNITGSNILVTVGHINNGNYIVDETITGSNNNYIKSLTNLNSYPVVRVTGSITRCLLIANTVDGRTQSIKQQPLLERIAYLPHATALASGSGSNWASYYLQREKIGNGEGTTLTYLSYAYENARQLQTIDLSNLRTPNVTSMSNMFSYCSSLYQSLDLRHFNVGKVTTFEAMFRDCFFLTEINLTGWQPPNKLNTGAMNSMFSNCRSVKHIYGLINFNISNCTSLGSTFYNCYSLESLENLSNWDTSNITSFYALFSGCMSITNLDFVSSWDTQNVKSCYYLFANCFNLEKLDLHQWNTQKITNVTCMFYNCISLKQLNITGWQINSVSTLSNLFSRCMSLQEIDLSGWNVTNTCTGIYECFYMCCSLKYLDLPNTWDLSGVSANTGSSVVNEVFLRCFSLKRITGISNWNLNTSTSAANMFSECYSLEEVDVSGWNVSKITSFSNMFANCWSLETIDVSHWDTSSCTSFASMFNACRVLKTLDLSNFDVSHATTLSSMFSGCYALTSVGDISHWRTDNVTTLYYLFAYTNSLQTIPDLSTKIENGTQYWNVEKVKDASYIFRECCNLRELTINNWNLAECTTIQGMFQYCYSLQKLTATGWSLPKLTTAPTNIFQYCYALTNYNGTIPITLNHNYNYQNSLTYESLINIFNNLPTITTTRTINITSVILAQTTTTERQIATNKGWTIAG